MQRCINVVCPRNVSLQRFPGPPGPPGPLVLRLLRVLWALRAPGSPGSPGPPRSSVCAPSLSSVQVLRALRVFRVPRALRLAPRWQSGAPVATWRKSGNLALTWQSGAQVAIWRTGGNLAASGAPAASGAQVAIWRPIGSRVMEDLCLPVASAISADVWFCAWSTRKTNSFSEDDMRGEAAMSTPGKVGGQQRTPVPKNSDQDTGRQENTANYARGKAGQTGEQQNFATHNGSALSTRGLWM